MTGILRQPSLLSVGPWIRVKDGDSAARAIFRRHYSYRPYRDGRDPALFVGPGSKMVLMTPDGRAMFAWRKFISDDGQQGVNCAVFRNEGADGTTSSDLIRSADKLAWDKWPGEDRHYTYVKASAVRSRNPGYCFLKAGWRRCGVTKVHKLVILEIRRSWAKEKA